MENFRIIKKDQSPYFTNNKMLELLVSHNNFEIMVQKMTKESSVWIEPADNSETFEFFFVLEGKLKITDGDKKTEVNVNDSFYAADLKKAIYIEVLEDSKLLYFSNAPIYNDAYDFQNKLSMLVEKIDKKDHYTKAHCSRTTKYVDLLCKALSVALIIDYENLIIASAIHDVGMYKMNDEVLSSYRSLDDNNEVLIDHVKYGAEIIREAYNDKIATIVLHHHEHLDGSGYLHLKENDLSLEDRILIVADRFDDLVTNINNALDPIIAAQLMYNQPEKYDRKITAVLRFLVESKKDFIVK